jgi:dUTP pyrophosphatase
MPTQTIPVEIKLLDPRLRDWGLPVPATPGAAAADLMACAIYGKTADNKPDLKTRRPLEDTLTIAPSEVQYIGAGFAMAILDPMYAAFILPRSGVGSALGIVLGNGTGLIDSDYHGEIIVAALNRNTSSVATITPGLRIAQMVLGPVVRPEWRVVDQFSPASSRGAGGFGSTGLK